MQKLYCYIDETGQDTNGEKFIVSAIVLGGGNRDEAEILLEEIEHTSGKGKTKWTKSVRTTRLTYIETVLGHSYFQGCIYYAVYRNSKDYFHHLAQTTELAIRACATDDYKATIVVDGLDETQERAFARLMRTANIRYKYVKGVKDETNAFIRLADAACGFIRAGLENHVVFAQLFKDASEKQHIVEL